MINKIHKTSIPGKPFKTDMHGKIINKGDILICPVCGKEFPVDETTCFICKGGYVCDWKCFLKNLKDIESEKKTQEEVENIEISENKSVCIDTTKKKRGRPKKNV